MALLHFSNNPNLVVHKSAVLIKVDSRTATGREYQHKYPKCKSEIIYELKEELRGQYFELGILTAEKLLLIEVLGIHRMAFEKR